MRHFIIFAAFYLFFLEGYSQRKDSTLAYCRNWHIYSFGLFGGGEINIYENGTFNYYKKGCTKLTYTSGRWKSVNDSLVLVSHKIFATKKSIYPKNKPRTDYVYFDKVLLKLENDTLFRIDGEIKYRFKAY